MVTRIKYIFLSFLICATPVVADNVVEGKKLAFDRKKGVITKEEIEKIIDYLYTL